MSGGSPFAGIDWQGYQDRGRQLHQGINNMPGVMRNPADLAGRNPDDVRAAMYPQSGANFDKAHYLASNPDVAASPFASDPFQHFQAFGRQEGRAPNARGVNPLEQILGIAMRMGLLNQQPGVLGNGSKDPGKGTGGLGLLNEMPIPRQPVMPDFSGGGGKF